MIPKDFKVNSPTTSEFEVMPEDTYQVEIENIELLQDQAVYQKPDEKEDRFKFTFRVVEEGEYKGRYLWKEIRPIMSSGNASKNFSPSFLYKVYCVVNQVKLSEDEAKEVDGDGVNSMIGQQLRVVVKQKVSGNTGKTYNIITDVLPLKQAAKPKSEPDEIIIEKDDLPF